MKGSVLRIGRRENPSAAETPRWRLESAEPWTRYRALVDLLDRPGGDPEVVRARNDLLVKENGWRCSAAPDLGKFRGPGRKDDPCPVVNAYTLKVLALAPGGADGPAAKLLAIRKIDARRPFLNYNGRHEP